ncbi:MAG: hypothetical protein ACPGQR_03820 [Marinirhabdus sp.]
MKPITLYTTIVAWALAMTFASAQTDNTQSKLSLLEQAKNEAIASEKEALRAEVERIAERLDNKQITFEEAEKLKKEAAKKRALNIENKVAIIDNKIELLERNGSENNKNILSITFGDADESKHIFGVSVNGKEPVAYDERTVSEFVFSFGLNNALTTGQSLDGSPYKIGGSRYTEFGIAWKTRVFKESNWLRFKYGLSFQLNALKPTDNRFFVQNGNVTELQTFPIDLDKSKFRMDNLVIPVHFEVGGSRKIEKENYFRYSTENKFKLGLGGYAGLNLSTRQKLKFEENGENIKQKLKGNYNTNNFIYGLSGYIGYGDVSIYAKYDLNTIFKNNPTEERNVSLGIRWDWD